MCYTVTNGIVDLYIYVVEYININISEKYK